MQRIPRVHLASASWTTFTHTWSQFSYVHEHKAHGLGAHITCIVGAATMANKRHICDSCIQAVPLDSKCTDASFSPNLIDSLCLRVTQASAYILRSSDFSVNDNNDDRTNYLPLVHARGVTIVIFCKLYNRHHWHRVTFYICLRYIMWNYASQAMVA